MRGLDPTTNGVFENVKKLGASHAIAILENRVRHRNDTANFLNPAEPFFLAVGLVRPHVFLVAPERLSERLGEPELTRRSSLDQ